MVGSPVVEFDRAKELEELAIGNDVEHYYVPVVEGETNNSVHYNLLNIGGMAFNPKHRPSTLVVSGKEYPVYRAPMQHELLSLLPEFINVNGSTYFLRIKKEGMAWVIVYRNDVHQESEINLMADPSLANAAAKMLVCLRRNRLF